MPTAANTYVKEPIPGLALKELFEAFWDSTISQAIPIPRFVDVTGQDQPLRHVLTKDLVTLRADSPSLSEEPIGNHTYGNQVTRVVLEFYTNKGRQRLYDLMREVRRICHAKRHDIDEYQRVLFLNFTEETNDTANVWEGRVLLELENLGVILNVS